MNTHNRSLILIHGWGFNNSIWQYNLDYLKARYNNVVTINLNGHGDNKYNPEFINLDLYLDYLIKNIPIDADILGWSLGGIIALKLKEKYSDHINNITLCCSTPCFINNNQWQHGVLAEAWDEFYNDLITDSNKTLKNFILLQTLNHSHSKQLYKQLLAIHKNSPLPSNQGLNWGLEILKQDYTNSLNIINNKTIRFIFGSKDLLVNKSLISWLNNQHPNIKTFLLDNSGHMPFITEPEKFYNCLDLKSETETK